MKIFSLDALKIIVAKITGMNGLTHGIKGSDIIIIEKLRLPRALLACIVGASLSCAGAAMQGLLKNPLAEGSTLGVSAGASLGAVIAIFTGFTLSFMPQLTITIASIVFAFVSIMIVLFFSSRFDSGFSNTTIILFGVIFAMFINSGISFIISQAGENTKAIVFWFMGSLAGKSWSHIYLILPFFVISLLFLLRYAKELDAFALGEDEAQYMGVNVKAVKIKILICISVLVGASVSVSGTIAFVGLVIPHIARKITGPKHLNLMVLSAFGGAIFLMLMDLISRTLLSPIEMPIGIATSFIGSLIFIYIFYTQRNKE